VLYTTTIWEIYFFNEIFAIMPFLKGIGFKKRNFGDFSRAKRSPKPFLDCGGQGEA
jgi:hypothetical protein